MDWNKLRRATSCAGCGRRFADGDDYSSFLFSADGEMERRDYCASCGPSPPCGDAGNCVSRWHGRYRAAPERVEEEPIAKSLAERLLRKYIDSTDPAHVNVRYILCLMMERKKRLVPRDTITESDGARKIIVYEMPKTGETFLVEDPGLSLSQSRLVQRQVRDLLQKEGAA